MPRPDQRHLRRAADAAAFEDSRKNVTVAVELRQSAPFGAVVLDPEPPDIEQELEKLRGKTGVPWAPIPCRTEKSALRRQVTREQLYFILHDWWSPLVTWNDENVKRRDVASFTLVAKDKNGNVVANVNLNELLSDVTDKQGTKVRPDALFFSFEALDKFLFPQLANTYGVSGAWTERNRIRTALGDEVKTDAEEEKERLAEDQALDLVPAQ